MAEDPHPTAAAHFKPGDRVAVDDPALAELRAIMREHGHEPDPNNEGVVDEVRGDTLLIIFDDGQGAPYPASTATLIEAAAGG